MQRHCATIITKANAAAEKLHEHLNISIKSTASKIHFMQSLNARTMQKKRCDQLQK